MAPPAVPTTSARGWRYRAISRSCRRSCWPRRATPTSAARPVAAQAVAVAQQAVEGNEGVAALDPPGIEHSLDSGDCLDDDADVLVLLGEAVDPAGIS